MQSPRLLSYAPRIARVFLVTVCVLALLGLTACSTTGSGSGNIADPDNMMEGSSLLESDLDARREARFGIGSIPTGEGEGPFRDVRFQYDSDQIDDAARQNIEYNVQILQENPGVSIQLEGHCDERGTAEYNLALGERRARAVHDLLVSYGIQASRMQTISYGEEIPLSNESGEAAWSMNRRVHFSAFRGNN